MNETCIKINNRSRCKNKIFRCNNLSILITFVFIIGISVGFLLSTLFQLPFDHITNCIFVGQNKNTTIPLIKTIHDAVDANPLLAKQLLNDIEEAEARKLAEEIRILCLVITCEANHQTKAIHVKNTWGRHCNKLIFISEAEDITLPTVAFKMLSNRYTLWSKTLRGISYAYNNYQDQYDWVIKADDDTYVVVENLRKMLLAYKPTDGHYFGFRFKQHTPSGYASGGAGYVLSREAVDRLVNKAFFGKNKNCPELPTVFSTEEDVNMARCLTAVNVTIDDSRDLYGKHRFLPLKAQMHAFPNAVLPDWFEQYIYWPAVQGLDCCSDKVISFHYVEPDEMYMLEYLIYYVNAVPINNLLLLAPPPLKNNTHTPLTADGVSNLIKEYAANLENMRQKLINKTQN